MNRLASIAAALGVILLLPAAVVSGETPTTGREIAVVPLPIDRPLLAYWNFDEPARGECLDSSGNGYHAAPAGKDAPGIERTAGVFGGALSFSGNHMLRVAGKLPLEGITKISFSAWVIPTELSGYREIFRKEDGDRRVLFSFQLNGSCLSLGLNIHGYVELRAPLRGQQVLDGRWHHCAATFDGRFPRVYLDGEELGSLERPGPIDAGGPAPGCIGSSNGGECLQGTLDELRIYRDALTAAEIARLYQNGTESLLRRSKAAAEQVRAVYVPGKTFAETLAGCRKIVVAKGMRLDAETAGFLTARIKAAFPDHVAEFVRWARCQPSEYLRSPDKDFPAKHLGRLVDMMLEYKPLTEHQWKQQSPDELRKWDEAEALRKKAQRLAAQGDAARDSPEWIELMIEVGRKIQVRPYLSEAVAPYVATVTPPTRDLSADEALETQRRDWLHQADGNPAPGRIQDEIRWTRRLAQRIASRWPGKTDFSRELAELDKLADRAAKLAAPDRDLYFAVRVVKREIALGNPVVNFDKVLLVDMLFPQGSEWPHETRHRLGYMAVPGGRLLVLDGLRPGGHLTQLMPQPPLAGSFWRPDLSYDAKRVLFCFKPHNEKAFHLYEIGVGGAGLTQLTDGIYDDLDPIYLPDDRHLLFSTTRAHSYVRCMPPTNAYVLARCDRDGKNVYLVSYNNEPDYLPSVMNDGRVIYTRWEYTDKPLWRAAKLWAMNPDGTQVSTFWGNQSVWPDLVKDARNIPGSRRVLCTGSAHHNWFSGSVAIIDPDGGFNFPDGITKVTADVAWPECGNGPIDPAESTNYHRSGQFAAYYSPYPLGEQDFLVSANREGKFLLYLMDVEGNRELIYEGTNNVFHAMPLRPRRKPPEVADRVAWPDRQESDRPQNGVIFSANVYAGAPDELRGKARALRVFHIDPKTYTYWNRRPYISTGPVVSAVQSEGVKRILGTVPIEADGSVAFSAPPGKALHFQLLDERGRALQTMRSFVGVMPGERRGCLGCHESHSRTPSVAAHGTAMSKEPRPITPPPWRDDTVSYPRYVRPVLDKYCGKCHEGDGGARKVLDLTERPSSPVFTEPYLTLIGRPTWGQPYKKPERPVPGFGIANMLMVEGYGTIDPLAYRTPKPMTRLSYNSPLVEIAASGKHYGVEVDPISLQRLIVWVDAMCPYCGDEEVREIPDPEFPGVDWLSVRPKIKTAPRIVRPGPVD